MAGPGRVGSVGAGLAVVLVDVMIAAGLADAAPERGPRTQGSPAPWLVVHLPGEQAQADEVAPALGAVGVVELPTAAEWLAACLQPGAEASGDVVHVFGAVGGAGASTVAIACASARAPDCLLVDVDPGSTGLDLPLGIGAGEGGRWTAVPDSGQPLLAESLRAALPEVGGFHVLTGPPLQPGDQRPGWVLAGARPGFGSVVVDGGQGGGPAWVDPGDRVIIVLPATLPGVVGARRLMEVSAGHPVLLAVRPSSWLDVRDVADQLGGAAVLEVPTWRGLGEAADCGDVLGGRRGRAVRQLGQRCWEALA
ncbi:MAG TPA: hypothetical protein VF143_03400 [Candidatus Nanopelagicales bacterium]